MALTNSQHESIMRGYERRRDANRSLLASRQEKIFRQIPGYEELTDSVSTLSVDTAKMVLAGNDQALSRLHDSLQEISRRQKQLLRDAGYPEDYLEPVYDCPDCRDTGYISGADGRKEKCHCFRQQEIAILYDQSNIREMIARENFSTLSYDHYQGDDLLHFKAAVSASLNFIQTFKEDYHNLFFYGTVGTGKSFLSGCIANELIRRGHSVIYFSALNLFECLAYYSFDPKEKAKLHSFYEDIYGCDLLVIDDLGTETTNAFINSQLFACLNERQLRRNATVISTNLNLEELQVRYSDRIFSRLTSSFTFCKLTGADIRISRL
ncbi:MAG: ATP-binding protein [Lachnospiraceae bacterium]|nr:ATP-binding protein [Lachnospiraceae bacterium]MCM1237813.1 ATP-binding protein [Lachnospiraceae bacterium]MCM1302825.1 ATP-binding protein [Butyrivibrio sp.]MCM1342905.1 ATP-binding protein [Muribaculaceae bacterium]MCM1409392.1 ATP-binding protein [Lachnospiraceae bacterium]